MAKLKKQKSYIIVIQIFKLVKSNINKKKP